MSDLNPDIDLGRLARADKRVPPPPRFKKIWLLPVVVVLVFLVLLWSTLGDLLRSAKDVTIIRPRPASGVARPVGTVLLQAAGWVEPDPFPTTVSALTDGVLLEMLVQESQSVAAGEIVARLVPDTKAAQLRLAEGAREQAAARLKLAEVELANAQESFDTALAVTEKLAVNRAQLDAHVHECARNVAALRAVAARLDVARAELETQKVLRSEQAAGPWQVELAAAKLAEIEAEVDRARLEHERSLDLRKALAAQVTRAERDVELRLEDKLRLKNAQASIALQRGMLAEADAKVTLARLDLDWCEVRAPVAGVVLERLAMPGSVVGAAPVCTIYDPKSLRLRVDVPQADVAALRVGQKTLIVHNARPERPYEGRLIRIVERANIQKVTLEAQVAVIEGDDLLKPEMLCQVRFLGDGLEAGDGAVESAREVMLVPQRLIVGPDGIWTVDAQEPEARLRKLKLGARRGDDVEVLEGLNASDKLIDRGREGLEEGDALRLEEN